MSLKAQLSQLKQIETKAQTFSDSKKPSVLFGSSEAAGFDMETIQNIALQGYNNLIRKDPGLLI